MINTSAPPDPFFSHYQPPLAAVEPPTHSRVSAVSIVNGVLLGIEPLGPLRSVAFAVGSFNNPPELFKRIGKLQEPPSLSLHEAIRE
ncbi:hypothetical protein NDU88_004686 [Pleurodeles waltl]|uniref:Uncharacterized protein n=1 Tax=Pleurodeles waltl TaxID=8319 RepID=A0AAV7T931_PLEWA|nr:hypothetical protein NDU88_004686 [Pleurodeles waltl]